MTPVFGHGRLRLYLLKLLDESPRHGYEVIRLLQDRFLGLYAPSAGTVYPRLAKLEQEGLVEHDVEGGRKVYRITAAGRAELAARQDELAQLEAQIRESVYERAREIRDEVRSSAQNLREELGRAAREVRQAPRASTGERPGPEGKRRPTPDGWEPIFSQRMADLAEGLAHNLVDLAGKPGLQDLERELRRRFGATPPEPTTARARATDAWAKETDPPSRPTDSFDLDTILDTIRTEIAPLAHRAGITTDQFDQARHIVTTAINDLRALFTETPPT
ncbi:PadR family transcriptional regulator [Embleya scabrispora]|uniref:PadR family transcriptional regulator n=1 Tax=Embleya scabrispora TaxID=159449 RepID=UPI00036B2673|nr:PadR family transcriptional regulator [Embleya scabrispora]MYS86947.1 PadR family transcriptional regulator [Streptomyces sp. SID5474]